MAKLGIEISKTDFDALDASVQQYYVANGDKYELEGVGGMVRGYKTDLARFDGFKGLNADEAKKAVETLKSLGVDVDAETLKKALETQKKVVGQ